MSNTDFIRIYENALDRLNQRPDDRLAKHQAVLSLARLGSTKLALFEYQRYGLDQVKDHEDIMALEGRLYKDLYETHHGNDAIKFARLSAQKYHAAFKATQGYYSGVNAATMDLMADAPRDSIVQQASHILSLLPDREGLQPTDHYFIEATRAECLLLRGDMINARDCLKAAMSFDPQNYVAHASTLRQFRLILNKQHLDTAWLSELSPPRPICFAGHIWNQEDQNARRYQTADTIKALKVKISDNIQTHDIGYGYGALAAGADILIAETLLAEGADLHIILPCSIEHFLNHSVRPFGDIWEPRFRACLEKAQSVMTLDSQEAWPNPNLNRVAGQIAMGAAQMKALHCGVAPKQLLIWDQTVPDSFTTVHAEDWASISQSETLIIPLKHKHNTSGPQKQDWSYTISLLGSNAQTDRFSQISEALKGAGSHVDADKNLRIWLDFEDMGHRTHIKPDYLDQSTLPPGLYVSEPLAFMMAASPNIAKTLTYAGHLPKTDNHTAPIRCYRVIG